MNPISRPRRYGIWIVLALVAAAGGYYWIARDKKSEAVTLTTSAVTRGDLIESISSTGTLSALEEVTVGSQVSGIVTKVLVDYNDEVKKGQLLAVIDPQTLEAQVKTARLQMDQRQTAYDEAVKQLEEGKALHAQKYISDKELRTLENSVSTAKSQLESSTADYEKQSVQLGYAEIRAPMDGVIMTRSVDPGNTVQSNMSVATMFVVASDLTKMKILASVDETQIAQIKEGMKAKFTVSGISDKTFNAAVTQVRLKSSTNQNVVTYTVVLTAENPEKLLFPGMTATIDFIQSSLENVLMVPTAALRVSIPNELRVETDQQQQGQAGQGTGAQAGTQAGAAGSGMSRQMGQEGGSGDGQNGGPPAGFSGEGMNGPPAGFDGGQGGGQGMGMPGGGRNAVWMVNEKGLAYRVPVRILGADLTNSAVEPMQADVLKEGDAVVTRVVDPGSSSSSDSKSSSSQNNMMMPGLGGGGFPAGMGPG